MFRFIEKRGWLAWTCVFILAVIIFYISSLTFAPGKPSWNLNSIFYHFIVFFWFAFFLLIAFIQGKRKNLFLPAILIALFYAVLDEFHQLFVPGRACAFSDFMIDSSGIFLAGLIYLISLVNLHDFSKYSREYY